jgi:hypothetical protein
MYLMLNQNFRSVTTSVLYKRGRIMTSWSLLFLFLSFVVMTTCAVDQEDNNEGGTCSDHEDGTNSCSHLISKAMLCRDEDSRCLYWAERGECSINTGYMQRMCPQSCEFCTGRVGRLGGGGLSRHAPQMQRMGGIWRVHCKSRLYAKRVQEIMCRVC